MLMWAGCWQDRLWVLDVYTPYVHYLSKVAGEDLQNVLHAGRCLFFTRCFHPPTPLPHAVVLYCNNALKNITYKKMPPSSGCILPWLWGPEHSPYMV